MLNPASHSQNHHYSYMKVTGAIEACHQDKSEDKFCTISMLSLHRKCYCTPWICKSVQRSFFCDYIIWKHY